MNNQKLISLVIFTCEGREHLLKQTMLSFSKACSFKFSQVILVIDGQINHTVKDNLGADLILQSPKRKGYVNSISKVIPMIKTPYFFWLEDDWDFPNPVEIAYWLSILEAEPTALQLVLAKDSLNPSIHHPFTTIHQSDLGFSANPSINKTQHIQQAFLALEAASKNESTKLVGFENYIENYRKAHQLLSLMIFNKEKAYVAHSGYLESTAREFHMINSIDEENSAIAKEYISGFGYHQKISLRNKLSLTYKLTLAFTWLTFHAFSKRYVYDYGLRIYNAYLKKFKS